MRRLFVMPLLLLSLAASAGIDVYSFSSPEQEQRFTTLTEELRCPKCQNSNLAGSNAPIAKDLKDRIYQLMQQGKSDEEIKAYLVDRYGDFIVYKPPLRADTLLLWCGPFALMLAVVLTVLLRTRRSDMEAPPISEAERERLRKLLSDANTSDPGIR